VRIYVVRHAEREVPKDIVDAEDGDPDAELTPEGREVASGLGAWMAENEEIPATIYASPAVRTQETAELICKAIEEAGFVAPQIKTDVGIGPHQSIRSLVYKLGAEETNSVAIVSHRETIHNGLQALLVDNEDSAALDPQAMGEMRLLKVKRKSGRWKEKSRVRPSDFGFPDNY
jgi:phosphohistidine phosphatase SixA